MLFKWDDSLALGIQTIDSQHMDLLRELSKLMDNLSMGYMESVRAALEFLQDYTVEHFSQEEKFMLRYLYPDFYAHRDEHSHYIKKIYDYKIRLRDEGVSEALVEEIKKELGEWFVNHIKHTDMRLGAYLKQIDYAPM